MEQEYKLVRYSELKVAERSMLPEFDNQDTEDMYRTLDDTVTGITIIRDLIREVTHDSNYNTDSLNTFLKGMDAALITMLESPARELDVLRSRLLYRQYKTTQPEPDGLYPF